MRTSRILAIAVAAAALSTGAPAQAKVALQVGVKWLPLNYTQPVSTVGAGMANTPLNGFNIGNLSNYFGVFFLDGRIGPQLSLDLGYSSRTNEIAGAKADLSFVQFGFSLGAKFYMTKPARGRVTPYLYVDFYKYTAAVTTSATVPRGYEGYVGGLASPLGINLAFGAEYFFTSGFSLGAEILGFRYGFAQGEYQPVAGAVDPVRETNHTITFYTGISLNYRFEVQGQVRVRQARDPERDRRTRGEEDDDEDEEEAKPPRKRTSPTPPPKQSEPPPQDAEEVD